MKTLKKFMSKYGHAMWIVAYMAFYLVGFFILEHAGHRHYHVIHSWLDDQIPFCEYFIIPYLLWFFYIAAGVIWFIVKCEGPEGVLSADIGAGDWDDSVSGGKLCISEQAGFTACRVCPGQYFYTDGSDDISDGYTHECTAKYPCV